MRGNNYYTNFYDPMLIRGLDIFPLHSQMLQKKCIRRWPFARYNPSRNIRWLERKLKLYLTIGVFLYKVINYQILKELNDLTSRK